MLEWYTNGWVIFGKNLLEEGYIVGEPMPTEKCDIEYLKNLGLVGFYKIKPPSA